MRMQRVQLLSSQPCCLHIFAVSCSCKQVGSTDGVAWSQQRYPQWTCQGFVEHPLILTRCLRSLQQRSLFALPNWMQRPRLQIQFHLVSILFIQTLPLIRSHIDKLRGQSLRPRPPKLWPKKPRISDLCKCVEAEPPTRMLGVQLLASQPCCLHIFAIYSCKQVGNTMWLQQSKMITSSNWCHLSVAEPTHLSQNTCYSQRWVQFSWRTCLVTAWYPRGMRWRFVEHPWILTRGLGINLKSEIYHFLRCQIECEDHACSRNRTESLRWLLTISFGFYGKFIQTLPLIQSYIDELRGGYDSLECFEGVAWSRPCYPQWTW